MKHPSSREFFAYWDEKRGAARAPDRSEIEPGAVRELLGDIFVLSYDETGGFPFRVAGTRVCALLGCDLKNKSFSALFTPQSRGTIEEIVTVVAEEMLAAVAGISATTPDGRTVPLELLLLPFNTRAHTPISLTGLPSCERAVMPATAASISSATTATMSSISRRLSGANSAEKLLSLRSQPSRAQTLVPATRNG